MLKELISNLQTLKNEVDQINQLPEDQREVAATALAEKVLNTLENADIEISDEYSIDSGIEISAGEV